MTNTDTDPTYWSPQGKDRLIFSDGTGQVGGLRPDQRLSNVYKLYRAVRPDDNAAISPARQVAFYDAGLGASEGGGDIFGRLLRISASAFGTGISENVIECYEAILHQYERGDRVFLFGFSRGAYTARSVARVLNLCGVPITDGKNGPLPRYGERLRKIAAEAVYEVHDHGLGHPRAKFEDEREEKADRFRTKYGSQGFGLDGEGQGNVAPHFIGVFDTVASLGTSLAAWLMAGAFILSSTLAGFAFASNSPVLGFLFAIPAAWLAWRFARITWRQQKTFEAVKDGKKVKHRHMAAWDSQHYDQYLDTSVRYARHARAIDEDRARFPLVKWAYDADVARLDHLNPKWLKQLWFAGNHSDIGGSYPESESRLSDIALDWMATELGTIERPPTIDEARLNLTPDASGMQHDEVKSTMEIFPSWLPFRRKLTWGRKPREIGKYYGLHESVFERFELPLVTRHDKRTRYRPPVLAKHEKLTKYYSTAIPPENAQDRLL